MYWPVGAPRIFAADNVSTVQHILVDDNVDSTDQKKQENDSAITDDPPVTGRPRRLTIDTGLANGSQSPSVPAASGGPQNRQEAASSKDKSKDESTTRTGRKSSLISGEQKDGPGKKPRAEVSIGGEIIAIKSSRSGQFFVSITRTTLSIWQTKPTAIVACVMRSDSSIKSYGDNVDVLLRPDSAVVVIQTKLGYLITYTISSDPSARLYQPILMRSLSGHARRRSIATKYSQLSQDFADPFSGPGEGQGVRELSVRFRMVIKLDAGISKALALEDELVVATEKPPALQCVRWMPDGSGSQATTALLRSMSWIPKKTFVTDMVHDRPMNISTWITSDGRCFAVRRKTAGKNEDSSDGPSRSDASMFQGYCFHTPESEGSKAIKVAICARFSLIAVACANGQVLVYTAKDYAGHVPLSHKLQPPPGSGALGSTSGSHFGTGKVINCLLYSPDGYALFVGYSDGWAMWSVYGKLGANSFASDTEQQLNGGSASKSATDEDKWLRGVKEVFWIGGSSQLALLCPKDNRIWVLNLARSAVTGCFSSANVARSVLQTPTGFMIYRGYDLPDLGAISVETGVWHQVEVPMGYLNRQWPIKIAVTSLDGRYVAVAGRRGLAHYSVTSGRWKIFEDPTMEEEFTVRGGMCWHQHVLITAVESSEGFQIRVYSRESALDNLEAVHVQNLAAPVVHIAPSGDDSLLVYTYENRLHHYIINASDGTVKLVLVGQIELHGIIRAPARVRALSWILPEDQLENGDPTQDVGIATILFLVDGKLVVLQPSTKDGGELKYDMRIVAQNVEYYALMRDQQNFLFDGSSASQNQQQRIEEPPKIVEDETKTPTISTYHQNDLRDSLWYFDGSAVQVWTDVQDLLASAPPELGRELPPTVTASVDFYPLSVLLSKGILFGIEPDVTHNRREVGFSMMKFVTRTQLFIPQILHHHLANFNSPSALYLCHEYSHLAYFSHALEVLLHDILDHEVDHPPSLSNNSSSLLPSVITLLSSFPQFLDIVVQCTRKTEVRSWRTLFAHLPPPRVLFERSLEQDRLKTAGGYLLVLHTLETAGGTPATSPIGTMDDGSGGGGVSLQMVVRLLSRAAKEGDWGLGMELARFLVALDGTGDMLRGALEGVGLRGKVESIDEDDEERGLDAVVNGKESSLSGLGIS